MKTKIINVIVATILLVAVLFVFNSIILSEIKEQTECKEEIYTLYIGLTDCDSETQVLTLTEALNSCRQILAEQELSYTEYIGYAEYTAGENRLSNDTIIYEFFFTEKNKIYAAADIIAERLNISAISIKEELVKHVQLNLY